jgi:hypothetical protein
MEEITKYRLCEWEENGYDDSDGYIAYYDTATGKVESHYAWSTRWHSTGKPSAFKDPTPEVVEAARKVLEAHIYEVIRAAEHRDVLEPKGAAKGDRLRTLVSGTFNDKKRGKKVTYEAGEAGEVIWVGHFGSFYSNGYNRRDRSNGRVGLKFPDGRVVFLAMSKVRKDMEPLSDEELRGRAERLSHNHQYGAMLSKKHAWDSSNWAKAVAKEAKKEKVG